MSNFWLDQVSLHHKYPIKDIKGHDPRDISKYIVDPNLIAKIETKVLDWLKNDTSSTIEFNLTDDKGVFTSILLFTRSEIYIKCCQNGWDHWLIADCTDWPRLISLPKKTYYMNNYDDTVTAPNEVRCEKYSLP